MSEGAGGWKDKNHMNHDMSVNIYNTIRETVLTAKKRYTQQLILLC